MTSTSANDRQPSRPVGPQVGLLAGRWAAHDQLRVPVDDIGFRQGATAVERLRTYNGNVFQLAAHLDRWQHTIDELGIDGLPLPRATEVLVAELIGRNRAFVDLVGDFGITIFATPGVPGTGSPTFGMHLNVIDHALIRRRREQGQPLVVTNVSPPPQSSWPRSIKVRSRLHYYLADQIAAQQQSGAVGVLVDQDGGITETSIANVAIVEAGNIVSPVRHRVLGGITQQVVEQLAKDCAFTWSQSTIPVERLTAADEVLLMGTDGGLWFAPSIGGKSIAAGQRGEIYRRLLARFDDLTG